MTQASNKQTPLDVWRKERTKAAELKGKEYKTWKKDKRVLEQYSKYRGLTSEEILTEAKKDLDLSYDMILEYFMYLTKTRKQPMSHNAGITYLAILRSFLTYNDILFNKKHRIPRKQKAKVRKTYRKLPLWSKDKRLNGDFRIWLDGMSKVHRSIALCILSSGQKTSMILRLNVDFVTEQPDDRLNLWLDTERIKTGEDVITFFSKEATRRLREYVKVHRKDAKPNGPLFVNERGERMAVPALQAAFRRATEKLFGETIKDNPLTPTRLRHLFESACRKAKLDPDIKKLFMGHKTSMSGEYNTDNIDDLLEEYLRVEPFLTIYEGTTSAEIEEDISKLKKWVGTLEEAYTDLHKKHTELQEFVKEEVQQEIAKEQARGLAGTAVELYSRLMYALETKPKKETDAFIKGLRESKSDKSLEQRLQAVNEFLDKEMGTTVIDGVIHVDKAKPKKETKKQSQKKKPKKSKKSNSD